MSHRRAEEKYPVDKYTKESKGMALFLLKFLLNLTKFIFNFF